jgi:hypothetical protein
MLVFRFPVVALLAGFLYCEVEARCQPPPVKLTPVSMVTDNPTYTVGIRIGTFTKTVVGCVGDEVGMPQAVTDLEREIDAVVDSVKKSGVVSPK